MLSYFLLEGIRRKQVVELSKGNVFHSKRLGSNSCRQSGVCVHVYTHTYPCVIYAIVIFLLPSLSFLISMEKIQMRCTEWCVWCRNLLRSKLHHYQWVRLSSGQRDHCRAEYSQWPNMGHGQRYSSVGHSSRVSVKSGQRGHFPNLYFRQI